MKKKKTQFSLLDQINADQSGERNTKGLLNDGPQEEFTEEEIQKFKEYNEKVTELDPVYAALKPLYRNLILRLFVKDFTQKKDDVLVYSKNDTIPVSSGLHESIIYLNVPSPYPFTTKAIVVASPTKDFHLQPGDVVALKEKLQIKFQAQDKGFISVRGGFIHPDVEENYDNMPEDPTDPHYGYVMLDESAISIKF